MNIVFYHTNGILPTFGGISRITDTLTTVFRKKGHSVYLVGEHRTLNCEYDEEQYFLPSGSFCDVDLQFLSSFIRSKQINIVINQAAIQPDSVSFLDKVKKDTNVTVWSCIHNSILTQVYNFAYQKEYALKKRGFNPIFFLLKSKPVSSFITQLYIFKYRRFYKQIVNCSDKVILLSPGHLKELQKMCGESSIPNAVVIPNCVDDEIFDKLENKKNVVVWVGTIDFSVKRTDLMLYIWQRFMKSGHDDWQLKILGSSVFIEEAKIIASKLGLKNVFFEGRVTPDPYYKEAKIVCITSTHESFSLVTVEGMRKGCIPIVFNSFPAASMIISNHNDGYLIDSFDVSEYVNVLNKCANDVYLEKKQEKAITKSLDFISDKVYSYWHELFISTH